jgi:hypothetical protein
MKTTKPYKKVLFSIIKQSHKKGDLLKCSALSQSSS